MSSMSEEQFIEQYMRDYAAEQGWDYNEMYWGDLGDIVADAQYAFAGIHTTDEEIMDMINRRNNSEVEDDYSDLFGDDYSDLFGDDSVVHSGDESVRRVSPEIEAILNGSGFEDPFGDELVDDKTEIVSDAEYRLAAPAA